MVQLLSSTLVLLLILYRYGTGTRYQSQSSIEFSRVALRGRRDDRTQT